MNDDTLLARWLEGELTDTELEEVKNSPRYATLVRIKDNFKNLQSPEFKGEGMLEEVLRCEKATPKVVPLYRRYWLQAAAVIIVLLGLGYVYTMPENLSAAYGKTYAFALPDDSEVILNSGSLASYSSWNWRSKREISLKGEAYFKVAKGKAFAVKTPQGTVTVLGTQFNVKARDGRFEVVCYEGRVRVQHDDSEVILTANERISFSNDKQGSVTQKESKEPEWLTGQLAFTDAQLPEIITELERKYNVTIQSDYQTTQLFTGSLPGNDFNAALKSVFLIYHLDVEKKADIIILTPVNAKP